MQVNEGAKCLQSLWRVTHTDGVKGDWQPQEGPYMMPVNDATHAGSNTLALCMRVA
jgi:hypothetical protein